ncbi:Cobalt/magnesium transport protein CorA [uncultured archaeon]|nr:Cobalt/magnesium transport protein CorA [uncultured archaeon]
MFRRDAVYRIFNDDVMIGLVAVLALAVIFPLFDHDLSEGMKAILDYVNYIVIAAFIAEYVLKLYVEDESRISFITDPLHVLDLFIIVIALLDFSPLTLGIPILSNNGELSPMLRLLRVPLRVLLALVLAKKGETHAKKKTYESHMPDKHLKIATLDEESNIEEYSKGDLTFGKDGKPLWIDFQDITENDLGYIEEISGIPSEEIKKKLIEGSFPRIDHIGEIPSILLWDSRIENYPQIKDQSDLTTEITSTRMLIVLKDAKIFTLTSDKSKLFTRIQHSKDQFKKENFTVEILYSLLQLKIKDYGEIVHEIESRISEFEKIPIEKTSPEFLHKTFLFRKEIQQVSDNLWHFHQVLDQIINKENLLHLGINANYRHNFNTLHSESKYICRTARNVKESLSSLIDLHVNGVSYDLNRVMKVIAVITCLAIIPSVIGGLLGVNLVTESGNSIGFQLYMPEIVFLVCSSMLLGLYAFYKMGWLR